MTDPDRASFGGRKAGGRFDDRVRNPEFDQAVYLDVDFSRRSFESVRTKGGRFERCQFSSVRFGTKYVPVLGLGEQTVFVDCVFDHADLTKVDLGESRFQRCSFRDAKIVEWLSMTAEFVDCVFAGELLECKFWGTPWGPWADRLVPRRTVNEFAGNDFRHARLSYCAFVAGIDVDAQRLPESGNYVRLDRFPERLTKTQTRIRELGATEDIRRGLAYLGTLRSLYSTQPVVFQDVPREPVRARIWQILAAC